MMSIVYHQICFIFIIFHFQYINCLIKNPAIGILTETNIYLAKINELNYTYDDRHLIYHHNDHVYPLQSFTSNHIRHQLYICSPSTIYMLDLKIGATIIPILPIDDTPCRSSLTYMPNDTTLFWSLRRSVIQLNFQDMYREFLWNSTSSILDIIYNDTIINDIIDFYIGIKITDRQSAVLHCRTDRLTRIYPFQTCLFIDNGYYEISTLAIDDNRLYVADRIEQQIYVLTLLSSGFVFSKDVLPLNTSTVADIQSMFIYNNYLIWLTFSGHVRSVSLKTYKVRNIFWFDESLKEIQLVSFSQWPNQTTTTTTTTEKTSTMITTISPTITDSTSTKTITTSSISTSQQTDTTTKDNVNTNPWKATTYVTSIILGIALFLCATMITCILLNYRLGRIVPNSFTNIFHILHNRTSTAPSVISPTLSDESLT